MALNTQFGALVIQLRDELGRANAPATNVANDPALKQIIRRTYEQLYDEHDWPHLRTRARVSLAAGQRYYDFPAALNRDRMIEAVVWYSGLPHTLERGITSQEFSSYDSADGDRSSPALRWEFYASEDNTSADPQFEIWPIPNANDMVVEFTGTKVLPRLVNDTDIVQLDDNMVALFCAAQLLRRQKSDDADDVAAMAARRFDTLTKQTAATGNPRFRVGLGAVDTPNRTTATVRVT